MATKKATEANPTIPEDARWFTIQSSHILREEPLTVLTALCGQTTIDGTVIVEDRPAGKTCETCLHIYTRDD